METKFEDEVMLYLRNIVTKMHALFKRMDKLEQIMMAGFRATGTAFHQTKTVVQAVVNEVGQTREDLSKYGGIIQESTYFDPLMRTNMV